MPVQKKITSEFREKAVVLRGHGRLAIHDGATELEDAVKEALEAPSSRIVLDMSDVTSLDSAGLGELVRSYICAQRAGARFELLAPQRKVMDYLSITKLLSVLKVYDSEQEANLGAPAPHA